VYCTALHCAVRYSVVVQVQVLPGLGGRSFQGGRGWGFLRSSHCTSAYNYTVALLYYCAFYCAPRVRCQVLPGLARFSLEEGRGGGGGWGRLLSSAAEKRKLRQKQRKAENKAKKVQLVYIMTYRVLHVCSSTCLQGTVCSPAAPLHTVCKEEEDCVGQRCTGLSSRSRGRPRTRPGRYNLCTRVHVYSSTCVQGTVCRMCTCLPETEEG